MRLLRNRRHSPYPNIVARRDRDIAELAAPSRRKFLMPLAAPEARRGRWFATVLPEETAIESKRAALPVARSAKREHLIGGTAESAGRRR